MNKERKLRRAKRIAAERDRLNLSRLSPYAYMDALGRIEFRRLDDPKKP